MSSGMRKRGELHEPDNGPLTAAQKVTILDEYIKKSGIGISPSGLAEAAQLVDPLIDKWRAEHYYQNVIKSTFVPLWFHQLALQHADRPDKLESLRRLLEPHMDAPRIMGREVGDKNTIRIWYDFCIHPLLSAQLADDPPCFNDDVYVRMSPKQIVKYFSSVRKQLAGQ